MQRPDILSAFFSQLTARHDLTDGLCRYPVGHGYPRPIIEDWRMTGSPQVDLGLIRKCALLSRKVYLANVIVRRGWKPSLLASAACVPQNRNG